MSLEFFETEIEFALEGRDFGDLTDRELKMEILRNLRILYGSRAGEQGLDRDFGIDWSFMDNPSESAKALLAAELVRKTQQYEPRVRVVKVEWPQRMDQLSPEDSSTDGKRPENGFLSPKVVIDFV